MAAKCKTEAFSTTCAIWIERADLRYTRLKKCKGWHAKKYANKVGMV